MASVTRIADNNGRVTVPPNASDVLMLKDGTTYTAGGNPDFTSTDGVKIYTKGMLQAADTPPTDCGAGEWACLCGCPRFSQAGQRIECRNPLPCGHCGFTAAVAQFNGSMQEGHGREGVYILLCAWRVLGTLPPDEQLNAWVRARGHPPLAEGWQEDERTLTNGEIWAPYIEAYTHGKILLTHQDTPAHAGGGAPPPK
jgi:hypothetical protein